jgi:hypothetical protein
VVESAIVVMAEALGAAEDALADKPMTLGDCPKIKASPSEGGNCPARRE